MKLKGAPEGTGLWGFRGFGTDFEVWGSLKVQGNPGPWCGMGFKDVFRVFALHCLGLRAFSAAK